MANRTVRISSHDDGKVVFGFTYDDRTGIVQSIGLLFGDGRASRLLSTVSEIDGRQKASNMVDVSARNLKIEYSGEGREPLLPFPVETRS